MIFKAKSYSKFILAVLFLALLSGCLGDSSPVTPENGQPLQKEEPVPDKKPTAVYYDFDDVLIPVALDIVKEKTVVVSTPGFTSGMITLKGRVERRSLFNFFNNNMQKDNWEIVSQIKSPGTTIMVFQKVNRTSVITIRDEQFYTYVEVGVAPTVSSGPVFSNPGFVQ